MRTSSAEGLSRFVGREGELARVRAALAGPTRLVTLLGPGGIGKTRLAEELVARATGSVVRCLLADTRTTEGLVHAFALGLGAAVSAGETARQAAARLGRIAGSRGPLLVLLDNFEQLPEEAAGLVGAWIDAAPEARWVVASPPAAGGRAGRRARPAP